MFHDINSVTWKYESEDWFTRQHLLNDTCVMVMQLFRLCSEDKLHTTSFCQETEVFSASLQSKGKLMPYLRRRSWSMR